jgi:RND family efflux transporter MFP subunit
MKKFVIILAIVLLIAGAVFAVAKAQTANAPKFKTTKAKRKDLVKKVTASGKIKAKNQVDLKFQTSGQLVWVGVKEGDHVNAWQAIAQLDKRELEERLLKALRDYSKTRWDFEEDRKVTYKDTFVTDTVKRILEKNQFDLDKAVADVEIVDMALKFSTLVTPISGIVTEIDTSVAGINITPATAVFTISDPDSLIFSADIDEGDIGQIKENQEAEIELDAYSDEKQLSKVGRISFNSISTSGGGTAFPAEFHLPDNKDLRFKIGMNGDVSIKIAEKINTIVLPVSVIIREKEGNFIKIFENNEQVKKMVTLGLETDDEVEILSGISEGQTLILEGKK